MPSQAQPDQPPLPTPPIPPASPSPPTQVPDGLQPKTTAPGAGTPLAPALSTVAAKQPTDTGLPPPVTDTPRWQEMSPTQLYNPQFPPVAVAIGQPESGMQNIRQRIKDPVTGQLQPAGQGTGPASGYFQIEDDTWKYYAPRMGVDLTKWPTAMSAPPQVQWAVAQSMPLNRWSRGTYAGFRQQYPWVNGNMTLGQINAQAGGTDEYGVPRQYLVAATEREAGARFQPDPSWNSGTPGMMPSSWDIPRIMSGTVPQLLALGLGLFARVPLINAIAAYGAMAKAQQNGQILDYQMQKDRWDFSMKQHQDIQQMEGQDVDDALIEFKNNPEDMKQAMMGIARRYNDPNLNMLAQQERFDVIEQLQKRRDMLNQPLQKMQIAQQEAADKHQAELDKHAKAVQEQKDIGDEDSAVADLDQQYRQANPNATPGEISQAHLANIGKVKQLTSGKEPTSTRAGAEEADIGPAVDADVQKWTADQKAAGHDPTPGEIAQERANARATREAQMRGKGEGGTPARPGTVDQMMSDWLNEQKQDPKRWSGGAVGQGTYTAPSPDETAKERGHLTQLSSKPAVSSRQVGERLMIAANDVAKTLSAIRQLPAGTTLGIAGGAQTALGPDLVDNMRKGLMNAATPEASQVLATLSNGLGRSLAILAAAGSATGLVGLSQALAKDVPATGDKGYNVLTKLADMRQIAEAALEVVATDPNLSDDQKKELSSIKDQITAAVPFTTAEVVQKAFNRTPANMIDLARKLGVLKDQGGGDMPAGATKSATGPDGQKAYLIPGKGWVHADGTPAQ